MISLTSAVSTLGSTVGGPATMAADDDGAPSPNLSAGRIHSYGGAASLFGHLIAVVVTAESLGIASLSLEAYIARHLSVALLGLTAALGVGYATWVACSRLAAGLWAATAVLALPVWNGYATFAIKDVPAAAGWTLVTAALVVGLHQGSSFARPAVLFAMCTIGVWFSVGVRTALWVGIAASVLTFVVFAVARGACA